MTSDKAHELLAELANVASMLLHLQADDPASARQVRIELAAIHAQRAMLMQYIGVFPAEHPTSH